MKPRRVYSRNADFQLLTALKSNRTKRLREGLFWVEGVRNLNAAIDCGWHIRSLIYCPEATLSTWAIQRLQETPTEVNYQVSETLLAELSDRDEGSELLALVEMRDFPIVSEPFSGAPLLALMDRPSNRGNLGTLIRSCDAFGVDALVVTGHSVDLYDPETIRASMGSFFALPVLRFATAAQIDDAIALLRSSHAGFQVIGTSAQARMSVEEVDLTLPTLLLIGNETAGLSHRMTEICDQFVTIPMAAERTASSLNVACAATVLFYEAQRQRRPAAGNETL